MSLITNITSAEELVQLCIEGNISAYKVLYEKYSKAM